MSNLDHHMISNSDMSVPQTFAFAGGSVVAFSCRCPQKETPNEDSAAIISANDESGILVVADGMGGENAGDMASALAVRAMQSAVDSFSVERQDLRPAVLDGIELANRDVMALELGAATTIAAAEFAGSRIRPYHVGDSVVLVFGRNGHLKLETIAHSPVGHALEAGLLSEEEAMRHVERHIVSNYVGGPDMRIEIGAPLELEPHDTLLIASDGLSDNLCVGEIADIICRGELAEQTQELVDVTTQRMQLPFDADLPSKPDDLTFLTFRRA